MYDIGKQCFKSSGLRFVHVGLNLPKKVQKELNNRSKCDAKPGPGWNTLQPKKILLQQHWLQDFTSATVGLGGMGQGKEVTGPWRSGPYIGGADTRGKLSQSFDVLREIVHLDYKPGVISWDGGKAIPHVDMSLKRTKPEERFLVMKPPGFWYHLLPSLHLGENPFRS